MTKLFYRIFMMTTIMFASFLGLQAHELNLPGGEKMYFDENEFSTYADSFHIHIGHNVWLTTNTVHRDETGLFTYERNLCKNLNCPKAEYQKRWKCPYCHYYWPMGKPCGNADCPSKFR